MEIVEYQPDSWTAREYGKFMPSTRISDHMAHFGVLVGDLDKAMAFYTGILGFQEFWRGSGSPKMLSWVNMRVPDGQDYLVTKVYNEVFTQYAMLRPAGITAPDAPTVCVKVSKGPQGATLPGYAFTQEGSF